MEKNNIVPKKWGEEVIISNSPKYCGKILRFNKNGKFSMHYHMIKDETWYVNKGKFHCKLINTNDASIEELILEAGDILHIPPGLPHQLIAIEEGEIFEVSTQHFDCDSYRIEKGDSQNG